jgi:hypothetical protein
VPTLIHRICMRLRPRITIRHAPHLILHLRFLIEYIGTTCHHDTSATKIQPEREHPLANRIQKATIHFPSLIAHKKKPSNQITIAETAKATMKIFQPLVLFASMLASVHGVDPWKDDCHEQLDPKKALCCTKSYWKYCVQEKIGNDIFYTCQPAGYVHGEINTICTSTPPPGECLVAAGTDRPNGCKK